ncbi:uroporphyrinogen-III synthase [Halothiobacillus sp. DCM-1]|uniref:uroporphyrinogen-III synthase n=1 Tax=Halothiobacillus sp. DCM-1 TaxID=3112558 RepID=UPI0032500202
MQDINPNQFLGRTIALPESRQLDVLAALFERRGARVRRCPLVSIHDAPDQATVVAWIRAFIADAACRDLIILTGEGITRLVQAAERAGLAEALIGKLQASRLIVRGPKPGRALKNWGLQPNIQAIEPTSAGVIATLASLPNLADRVGVVLYGTEENAPLQAAIRAHGATPVPVAPYIYASEAETSAVVALIDELAAGTIDALAFTSQPQYQRLANVAKLHERSAALQQGLARTRVAAIGPVMAAFLREQGVRVDVMPSDRYFMKPLVDALAEFWNQTTPSEMPS